MHGFSREVACSSTEPGVNPLAGPQAALAELRPSCRRLVLLEVHVSASISASTPQGRATDELQGRLRGEVGRYLRERGLEDPEALGKELGLLPIAADGLLRRREWSVETALWVIERLQLPIHVEVRSDESDRD